MKKINSIDTHIAKCREYSRRKRALLVKHPNLSPKEYERRVKQIALEVGL